jgi:hypothetical protein
VEISFLISSYFLPISLLEENMVFAGFVTACLLAACPINLSPFLLKATIDGVVRTPSAFGITLVKMVKD